jgi:hypothetical protein
MQMGMRASPKHQLYKLYPDAGLCARTEIKVLADQIC